MAGRARVPAFKLDRRFFVRVRVSYPHAKGVCRALPALLDSGAQRTVIPQSLLRLVRDDGIDLRRNRLTSLHTQSGEVSAEEFTAQIVLVAGLRGVVQRGYTQPLSPLNELAESHANLPADSLEYLVLGVDALSQFRARLRFALRPDGRADRCRLSVTGDSITVQPWPQDFDPAYAPTIEPSGVPRTS